MEEEFGYLIITHVPFVFPCLRTLRTLQTFKVNLKTSAKEVFLFDRSASNLLRVCQII